MMVRARGSAKQPLGGLEGLAAAATRFAARGPAPVHLWNPEHCGDIGLAIDSEGTWSYRGSPIRRKALVTLFSSVLRRDDDGCHYLVTPVEKVVVHVADAPLQAVEMCITGKDEAQKLSFRTNAEDCVSAGPEHPMRFALDPENDGLKPYVRVRGRLEARLTRALTYDLVGLAQDGKGGHGVWSDGCFFPFAIGGAAS
ncbi:MAG: DUF1285 domain-containing protein [Pseudomonadota bacterium]|nr:DUF1285 domain-containing protein [Pseudomonadota bacterium]